MKLRRFNFVQNLESVNLLEYFLVSSISSVLIIRLFLALTGYPQIGGAGLHIAHMLWGGLCMLIAILIALVSINSRSKTTVAIIGGIGFGAFIDELGKFITSDNNYFYQPTISLIYIIFVLIFIFFRFLHTQAKYSKKTYELNAMELLQEHLVTPLSIMKRERLTSYLAHLAPDHAVIKLSQDLLKNGRVKKQELSRYEKLKTKLDAIVHSLLNNAFVSKFLLGYFIVMTVLHFTIILLRIFVLKDANVFTSVFDVIQFGGIFTATFFVVRAVFDFFKKNKLALFENLLYASLIHIFILQPFLFIEYQLLGVVRLFISVGIYALLQTRIKREHISTARLPTI